MSDRFCFIDVDDDIVMKTICKCEKCGREYKSLSDLNAHLAKGKHKVVPITPPILKPYDGIYCIKCKKTYFNMNNYNTHLSFCDDD